MKNAIIFHGTSSTPESFWHPYVKRELEKKEYSVWVPLLPDTDNPDIKNWLPAAQKGVYTKDTVLIGHSAGCPLVLSVLEGLNSPIRLAILVAGYARPKPEWKEIEKILPLSYDWEKIKKNVGKIIFINSDNDPWGLDDAEGRYMFNHLGGIQVILHGEGHMGSDSYNQPYKEFPLLVKLIE